LPLVPAELKLRISVRHPRQFSLAEKIAPHKYFQEPRKPDGGSDAAATAETDEKE